MCDNLGPVDIDSARGQAEQGDAPAVIDVRRSCRASAGGARHLQRDIEALDHAELSLSRGDRVRWDVQRQVDAQSTREFAGGTR